MSKSGYTLPVFACASAVAALRYLRNSQAISTVSVNLITPKEIVEIPIEQVASISSNQVLAITRSDPGDNLDLTKNTPIWAIVEWYQGDGENIIIVGGEGIGIQDAGKGKAAIYSYAQILLRENLQPLLEFHQKIKVTIILPEGRSLAVRTSNSAFGVVEGLSLLGTSGISQPLSTPEQLAAFQSDLETKAANFSTLVFCIGENGLDLGKKLGIKEKQLVKTANWLGPMLVSASILGVSEILLFGYHGKLLKLAGGIFHTHHHLADGRREILTSHCAMVGLSSPHIETVFHSSTAEGALNYLRSVKNDDHNWVNLVYDAIANTIDARCQEYIKSHNEKNHQSTVCGSVLFDRDRNILVKSEIGSKLFSKLCNNAD
ncbi:cobalt-precorrin-5B (C(1))-methyltransferase [Anabaena sp. FACHB-1237]|uniref:cobalt-precorrin-5B (C(1))-methyltransferase CbiD n=1 Tax=Anabaena sp. FACHB-1237 TaxID=2692769 RepID=UPI00168143F9|nr:cobalt-precorrin-5B (C(1))-methyltransferase CbiD [Anabaena sp. FACHB-1237]MBD2138308.1 cobalt-precorrin-5B (C(1))-methyltransferase [Anabaena sp. FACHB-1237]